MKCVKENRSEFINPNTLNPCEAMDISGHTLYKWMWDAFQTDLPSNAFIGAEGNHFISGTMELNVRVDQLILEVFDSGIFS